VDFDQKATEIFPEFEKMNNFFHRGIGSKKEYGRLHASLLVKIFQTPNFWKNLEWMPDGKKLVRYVKANFNPDQVGILTAPMPEDIRCRPGKWSWIMNNLGGWIKREHYFCDLNKERFIKKIDGKMQILIDDRTINVLAWRNAGGIAIHHKDASTTIRELEAIIRTSKVVSK
jgi:5'(3')-deoxyribonucleotidase